MERFIRTILIPALLLLPFFLTGQSIISVSGIVTDDNLHAIPYVNIQVYGTAMGSSTSHNGFFSIAVQKTDTLVFSAVGYQKTYFTIPDSVIRSRMSVVISMERSTVMLDETVIYPWPSPRNFKKEFLALELDRPTIPEGYFPPFIRKLDTIIPVEPNPIMNPASFIYEKVVLDIIERMPKRKKIKQLPKFE